MLNKVSEGRKGRQIIHRQLGILRDGNLQAGKIRLYFHGKEPDVFFVRLRPLFRRNENSAVLLRRPILFHNFPPFLFKKVHFLLENIRCLFQFIGGFQPQIGGGQLSKGRNRRYDFF